MLTITIRSDTDLPSFENSNVESFSLSTEDINSAGQNSPVTLKIINDIPAGSVANVMLSGGQAARIMTGESVRDDAEAAVMIKETDSYQRSVGSTPPSN